MSNFKHFVILNIAPKLTVNRELHSDFRHWHTHICTIPSGP